MGKTRKDQIDLKDEKTKRPKVKPPEPVDDEAVDEGVDEASDESFPASDQPSSQPLHSGGPDKNAHRDAK
jgi:hypothetical protein